MGPNDEEITVVQRRNSIRTSNNSFLTIVLEKLRSRRISGTRLEVKLVLAKFSLNALISSFLIKLHCTAEVSCKKAALYVLEEAFLAISSGCRMPNNDILPIMNFKKELPMPHNAPCL